MFQELEEIYSDLCSTVADGIIQGAEIVSNRVSTFQCMQKSHSYVFFEMRVFEIVLYKYVYIFKLNYLKPNLLK